MTNGSSPLSLLHLFVASNTSSQPLKDHFHFRQNPSETSHPLICHGGDQARIPRCSHSEAGKPSNSPPIVSAHKSSSSNVPAAKMTLSRQVGCGIMSIQSSCSTVRWRSVGSSDGGTVSGNEGLGRTRSAAEEQSLEGTVRRLEIS